MVLDVKNISVDFIADNSMVKAVDGISFQLNEKETIGIVGESGSGKSVTALSLMQLIPKPAGRISSGEIMYTGKANNEINITEAEPGRMTKIRGREIAMIFQEPMTSLNPVFTCGDQVAEAIMLHEKISRSRAKEKTINLFKKVKLQQPEQIFNAYPHHVSGGQKQRVMIAMAISCNPKILIADEPTTALDVTVQAAVIDLLKNIQEEMGMSVIFISHDLGVVAGIANRILVMYKGKIVEQGSAREIFNHPQHPYTKGLLACRPSQNKHLKYLPVISDFMMEDENGIVSEKNKSIEEVISSYVIKENIRRNIPEQKEPLLQIKNLKKYFPVRKGVFRKSHEYVKAVDDVSFEVYPSETLGLVGESGCGKTTLGRTVLRLIEPTSGTIFYKNKELNNLSFEEMRLLRKNMQIIFQDPYSSLNPRISIGEAIVEPMRVHRLHTNEKERKEKAMELLQKVNLKEEYFYRYPHEFSGGQRQRICIARALAVNPEFIVCDESVSALDVSVQAQVLNLLNDLKREMGFTYIFISHDLNVVRFMSDRMMVMNNGKIEEQGNPDEIYNNPQSPYTQRLIEAIPKGFVN